MRKPRVIDIAKTEAETEWLQPPLEDDNLPANQPPLLAPKGLRLARWFWAGLSGLILLAIGNWAASLLQSLFQWGNIWGYAGLSFAGLSAIAALIILWREWRALANLQQIEKWQSLAKAGLELHSRDAADRLFTQLAQTYRHRPELAASHAQLQSHSGDIMDPEDRIRLAERHWMAPLDNLAKTSISQAVKITGLVTAIAPSASFDMIFVAYQNLRLMRNLIHIYGGKPGFFASIKLMRMAFAHVAVAGGLALSDQFLQQFLGKGLAGKLSARLGEGAVNGILTARLGLAALDILRPLPWITTKKPQLLQLLSNLPKTITNQP